MTLKHEDRESLIRYRTEQAEDAIEDAQILIAKDRLKAAVNRIYYAVYYIVFALALKHKFKGTKHLPLIAWFDKKFVETNVVDVKYGEMYREAFKKRSEADYGTFTKFTKKQVLDLFDQMMEFVKKIKHLLYSDD
ncbi:MAG: HEPN domain-containing protein [Cytophagales bacterium]|nr:HEPN domain-containing protein [Cytophagales bacterium]